MNLIPDLCHSKVCVLFLLHAVKSIKYKSSTRWVVQTLFTTTLENFLHKHHRGKKKRFSFIIRLKGYPYKWENGNKWEGGKKYTGKRIK